MSMMSGIGSISSYMNSPLTQVTAISSIPRLQTGEQVFSLDSHPAGAEANNFAEQFQSRPATERQISTDATGIAISTEAQEFLSALPESEKLPIVSMNSNTFQRLEVQEQIELATPNPQIPNNSQAAAVQTQVAGVLSQSEAQRQAISQALPINQADTDSTYSSQARLIGGGASVEQTLFAGQESVHQKIYENDTDTSDDLQDRNLDGSDKQASTRDSEDFKVAGTETDQDDSQEDSSQSHDDSPKPENELSSEEQEQVRELKARDAEVRTHEQAHVAAGGSLIRGGIQYEMQTGPDGRSYAIGGSVNIDTSIDNSSPEAMIAKAQKIKAAALAPAEPSSADRAVAAAATQMEALGREAKQKEITEDMKQSLESLNTSTTEASSIELPEVEAVSIESSSAPATSTQNSENTTENSQESANTFTAETQNQNTHTISNNVKTADEKRDIVRQTVIASSIPTSSLQDTSPSEQSSSVSSVSSAQTLDAPPPKAQLPAEKPAPVSKGGSSRLNSDAEPVATSISMSSELQMSPGEERFRSNALSAYRSIRTQAA